MIFLAPELDALKEIALSAIDEWAAVKRARPAGQAAMDALKVAEAEKVRAGGSSALIGAEAVINKITPEQMADRILAASSASLEIEIERIQTKAEIRAAETHADVLKIVKDRGARLPNSGPQFGL